MACVATKKQLSPARQQLIELMQRLAFCHIRQLPIINGEPVLSKELQIIQDLKLGADNAPRVQLHLRDFALKKSQQELMDIIDSIQDGEIESIEVRYGLPYRVLVMRPL